MDNLKRKICSMCKNPFPNTFEYFYKNDKSSDGLFPYCKECNKRKSKTWIKNNRKQHNENKRISRLRNVDGHHEYNKKFNKRNPSYYSNWQNENKERIKQYNSSHRVHEITKIAL